MTGTTGDTAKTVQQQDIETQLEKTNEKLEMLLNALPVGIVIIDRETQTILDINPHGLAILGCPSDRLVGKLCTDFICPAEKGNCPIIDQKQKVDNSERQIVAYDGTLIPVLKSVMKTELDGREVLIECFVDISDKKKAEQEHIDKEKFQAIVEMAGAICHEFNQPLQIISGYCSLLKDNPDIAAESKEMIDIIARQVSRMGNLTRNLNGITAYETRPYLNKKIIDITKSSLPPHGA